MSATAPPKKHSRRSLAYRSLDAARIIDTAVALRGRIQEKFPRAGLCKIANEVEVVALGVGGAGGVLRQAAVADSRGGDRTDAAGVRGCWCS